jgi:hypothetical protein
LFKKPSGFEYFTVAWLLIEAAVAVGAGIVAHSITLIVFGIDSLIEVTSAGVLIWRLTVELRRGQASRNSPNKQPAVLGARCYSRWRPMSSSQLHGVCGRGRGKCFRGPACW